VAEDEEELVVEVVGGGVVRLGIRLSAATFLVVQR